MQYREFLDFRTESGKLSVREWLHELAPAAEEDLRRLIDTLERAEKTSVRDLKPLSGGISEIRCKGQKCVYRIFCCQGPGPRRLTMLVGVIKDGWNDAWKADLDEAKKRKRIVDDDPGRAHAFRAD